MNVFDTTLFMCNDKVLIKCSSFPLFNFHLDKLTRKLDIGLNAFLIRRKAHRFYVRLLGHYGKVLI